MMTEASCEFGARLDICGRHRGACARSGRLRARAVGPERSLARVCREAESTVRTNTLLRDMNLCVPITLRSALWGCGGARKNASHTDGAVLAAARRENERKYHELLVSERCRLVVVAMETGGRWSKEATDFISSLAEAKAWEAAPILRGVGCFLRAGVRVISGLSCSRQVDAFAQVVLDWCDVRS